MKYFLLFSSCLIFIFCESTLQQDSKMHWITLDPGHFHAALVQKAMYGEIDQKVHVYGPAGNDIDMHLQRIEAYNNRVENPTHWESVVYKGTDFLTQMLAERNGNVVMLSGNNKKKADYILSAIENDFHVYADKPMAINAKDYETLKEAFVLASEKGLLLYDIMTERSEITTVLQKELSQRRELFGDLIIGSPEEPAIVKESVHHYFKYVSGSPLVRPAWFFDTQQQGEGVADVSVHLVDLTFWECFPQQAINKEDVNLLEAKRWPTLLSSADFKAVTNEEVFPDYLAPNVQNDTLSVYANGSISYTLKGHHAKVAVLWNYLAPEGTGDTHYSIMRGSKAHLEILQGKAQNYVPTLYINPVKALEESMLSEVFKTLIQTYPGVGFEKEGNSWKVLIPDALREGHEAHFAEVTRRFINFYQNNKIPDWEITNMLTKYHLTTSALTKAQQ
jgi:predicted dehydrogenase